MSGAQTPDDPDRENGEPANARPSGRRRRGKYAPSNTDENGNYIVGKYRPPEGGKYRVGDKRARGRRMKGSKNLSTILTKQLNEKRTIGDKTKTNLEWLVDGMVRRGIAKSDRASEFLMSRAERLEEVAKDRLRQTDEEIIAAFLAQMVSGSTPRTTDDRDAEAGSAGGDESGDEADHGGDDDADQ